MDAYPAAPDAEKLARGLTVPDPELLEVTETEACVKRLAELEGTRVERTPAGPGHGEELSIGFGVDTDASQAFREFGRSIAPGRWWPAPKAQRQPGRRQGILIAPRRTRGSGRRSSGRPAGRTSTRRATSRSSSSRGDPDPPGEPADDGDGSPPGPNARLVRPPFLPGVAA